jgi:Family of unknown function (DUF6236)
MSKRGLVISRPTGVTHYLHGEKSADGRRLKLTVSVGTSLDPQQLRSQLLFWDELVHPYSSQGFFESPNADQDFLISAGILRREMPSIPAREELGGANHIEGLLDVFKNLDRKEPGKWSLAEPGMATYLDPFLEKEPDKAVLVRLFNSVPVPDKDVPLEDILAFKVKRADELTEFRHHLEGIYQTVVAAPDRPLAELTETEALDQSIKNALKASRDSGLKLRLGSLDAKLSLNTGHAALAAIAAQAAHLPLTTVLLAATGAGAKLELSASLGLKGAQATGTPLKYVMSVHNELFRQ